MIADQYKVLNYNAKLEGAKIKLGKKERFRMNLLKIWNRKVNITGTHLIQFQIKNRSIISNKIENISDKENIIFFSASKIKNYKESFFSYINS